MWVKEILSIARHVTEYPFGIFTDKVLIKQSDEIDKPLVLVHGFLSNKSIWKDVKKRFELLGWKNMYCFNYHVYKHSVFELVKRFSLFMDDVLDRYNYVDKVSLVGHSLGGIIIRDWVTNFQNYVFVDKVMTLGSPHLGTQVAHLGKIVPFRTRNIAKQLLPNSTYINVLNSRKNLGSVRWGTVWSSSDQLVIPRANALYPEHYNAKEYELKRVGHVRMAYLEDTTLLTHKFLMED